MLTKLCIFSDENISTIIQQFSYLILLAASSETFSDKTEESSLTNCSLRASLLDTIPLTEGLTEFDAEGHQIGFPSSFSAHI